MESLIAPVALHGIDAPVPVDDLQHVGKHPATGVAEATLRLWNQYFAAYPPRAAIGGQGLLTGVAVGFIEETCFRGAMYGAIRRESGTVLAILLPTALYAASHFLGGNLRIPSEEVTFISGPRLVANMFASFQRPLDLLDSFLALSALGVLLSLIRSRTRAIAGAIGLHAGAVCVIVVLRNISHVNPDSHWAWLVGSYDGVIGWMGLAWICLIIVAYWMPTWRDSCEARADSR